MPVNVMSFHRMDQATAEQWRTVTADPDSSSPSAADRYLARLRGLEANVGGFAVDELVHSLQCAACAERDGASDEMVFGALFHDVGHLFGDAGHGAIAAEIIAPYVPAHIAAVVRHHNDFTSRHYARFFDDDPDKRERHRGEPWFDQAEQFADEWDQRSFDPTFATPPIEHFEPLVRALVIDA
jgi:predicted HD phosphohydrolase